MRVNVYTHERTDAQGRPLAKPRPPLVLAYTRYQGEGACVHDVPGPSWDRATKQAIKEHRAKCLAPASERSEATQAERPDGVRP